MHVLNIFSSNWIEFKTKKKYARSDYFFLFHSLYWKKNQAVTPGSSFHSSSASCRDEEEKKRNTIFFFSVLLSLRKCMRIPIFYLSRMHSEKENLFHFISRFIVLFFIFHFFGVFDRLEIKGHTADSSVSRTWYPSHRRRQKPSIIYASRNETSHVVVVVVILRENGPSLKNGKINSFSNFCGGKFKFQISFSKFFISKFLNGSCI